MSDGSQVDGLVRFRVNRGVAMISLAETPFNALTGNMIDALNARLDELGAGASPPALCLSGEGGYFSSGAEPEGARMTPPDDIASLCDRIENWPRPVVAVLTGAALGTGAELALAAHARLATRSARIGLPDIAIGLPPRAGGSQRLTRVCGPDVALKLLLTGRAANAEAAHAAGLIDGVISGGEPHAAGHALASRLIDDGGGPKPASARRDRLVDGVGNLQKVETARAALGERALIARHRIVDCVEAAMLLPFAAGCAFEAEAFAECRDHAESRALRHLFLAERRISPSLLLSDDAGQRIVQEAGREVAARLLGAQDRAIAWLVSQGTPEVEIDAAFVAHGFARGPFGTAGAGQAANRLVWTRVTGALVAEGGRMIHAGKVVRAADIDALAVWGMGWPRRLGGPMIAAQIAGLPAMARRLKDWMQDDRIWAPPPPVIEAARVADGFAALPVSRG